MSDASFTSADLLLTNLVDHQVIRIEGSGRWMKGVVDSILSSQDHCIVLDGELSLVMVQSRLADYLKVENGASFIQQELKSRLARGVRLHIIIDSSDVEESALVYLLGLPSICDEQGTAATIILVSTSELVKVLKSSVVLAAKLDGYYQEEKDVTVSTKKSTKSVALGVAAICVVAGSWLYLQQDEVKSGEASKLANTSIVIPDSKLVSEPQAQDSVEKTAELVNDKKPEPESKSDKLAVGAKPVELEIKERAAQTVASDDSPKVQQPETEKVVNKELLADLTATVAKAKSKLDKETPSTEKPQKQPLIVASVEDKSELKGKRSTTRESIPAEVNLNAASKGSSTDLESELKRPEPAPVFVANNEAEVRKVIKQWEDAWAAQDWEGYINSYLQNTKPYGVKMPLDEWRAFRKKRLLTPAWIKLEIGEPKLTRLNTHWYRAEFYQRFEKPGYADETTKRLELTLTSSGWRIASEATDGTVVLKRPGA